MSRRRHRATLLLPRRIPTPELVNVAVKLTRQVATAVAELTVFAIVSAVQSKGITGRHTGERHQRGKQHSNQKPAETRFTSIKWHRESTGAESSESQVGRGA